MSAPSNAYTISVKNKNDTQDLLHVIQDVIERLCDMANEEGFNDGYTEGHKDGYREGVEDTQRR